MANKKIRALQIGAYTGDATNWMCNNILLQDGSMLVDVDTWQGSDEPVHKNMDFDDVYRTYLNKNQAFIETGKVTIFRGTSDNFFGVKPENLTFDFIYVDGDHTAFQVAKDGINAYTALNPGGIMAFDDYLWSLNGDKFLDPSPAIDWILLMLGNKIDLIEKNGQVWIRKL